MDSFSVWLINSLFTGERLEGAEYLEWYILLSCSLLWFQDLLNSGVLGFLCKIWDGGFENDLFTIAKQFKGGPVQENTL